MSEVTCSRWARFVSCNAYLKVFLPVSSVWQNSARKDFIDSETIQVEIYQSSGGQFESRRPSPNRCCFLTSILRVISTNHVLFWPITAQKISKLYLIVKYAPVFVKLKSYLQIIHSLYKTHLTSAKQGKHSEADGFFAPKSNDISIMRHSQLLLIQTYELFWKRKIANDFVLSKFVYVTKAWWAVTYRLKNIFLTRKVFCGFSAV